MTDNTHNEDVQNRAIPETMSIVQDPLIPPADLLSAAKTDKVQFVISKPKGYNYKQVDIFVEQVSRTLKYLERVIVEKDNLAQNLAEDINDLNEELNTMQYTLEVFRAKGDPLVDQQGEYVTEGSYGIKNELAKKETQLAESQALLIAAEAEIATLREVQEQAKKTVNDLNKELSDAWDDYDELRKWVDENIERLQESAENSEKNDDSQLSTLLTETTQKNEELLKELETLKNDLAEKQAENKTLSRKLDEIADTNVKEAAEPDVEAEDVSAIRRQLEDAEKNYLAKEAENTELLQSLKNKEDILDKVQQHNRELEEKYSAMSAQAEKAALVDTDLAEKNAAELVLMKTKLEEAEQREARLKAEVRTLTDAVAQKTQKVSDVENEISTLKSTLVSVEENANHSPLLEEAESEIRLLRARVQSVQSKLDETKMRERETVADTSRALSALETEREMRENAEQKMQEVLRKATQDALMLTRWEKERNSFASTAADAENRISELESQNSQLSETLRQEQQKCEELEKVVQHKQDENTAAEKRFSDLETNFFKLEQENLDFTREKIKLETSLESYKTRYNETKNALDVLHVEHEIMKENVATDSEETYKAQLETEQLKRKLAETLTDAENIEAEKTHLIMSLSRVREELEEAGSANAELERLTREKADAEARVKELVREVAEDEIKIEGLESDLAQMREELEHAGAVNAEVERLTREKADAEARVKELVREVTEDEIKIEGLESDLAQMREELEHAGAVNAEVERLTREKADAEARVKDADVRVKELVREVAEDEIKIEELESDLARVREELEEAGSANAEVERLTREKVDAEARVKDAEARVKELVREVAEDEIKIEGLESDLAQAEQELNDAVEDARQANDMVEELLSIRTRIDSRKKSSPREEKAKPRKKNRSAKDAGSGAAAEVVEDEASKVSAVDDEDERIQRLLDSPEITGMDDIPVLLDTDDDE